MRALIVDDEALARRELRRLLREHPWLQVVGEAANVAEAAAAAEATAPDLLFLDIHMPGGSGFELLTRLERVPHVIFTTAYDQHAVRAFEVDALDYLLKPVEPERLAEALARARLAAAAGAARRDVLERLFVQEGPRCWFVPLREVRLLSAEDDRVRLYWNAVSPLVPRALGAVERRLDPALFFRANRAQILNLEFIERIDPGFNGGLLVRLRGHADEVEMSRRQARLLRARQSV
ncbi:MAG: response regulator transcription factor [Proteobacteria bacterium]|nr:response regulator transcription factor [Pseudomonadota bacterium]